MSPETDILIVGESSERFTTEIRLAFRHWQVYNCASPFALSLRQFGRAYVTEGARKHPNWERVEKILEDSVLHDGGEVLPFEQYSEPTTIDPQDWKDAVLASDIRRSRAYQAV